ncbi:MAG: class II aldolase/adducin family protein [Pirellulales bacterium]
MTLPTLADPRSLWLHPRDALLRAIERIYRLRMTTTSGGNLSIREPDGSIWITPARVDKGSLRREDIVCVRPDGSVDGRHPPSSEFPFHKAIYDARPDLYAIVHAHPVALVACSISRQVPDTRLFHQAHHVCGDVGFAPYALPGSGRLAQNIADTFSQGFSCVVLENHGVVVAGAELGQAFQRFETLEFTAKTIIKGSHLGPVRYLSDEQLLLARRMTSQWESFEHSAPSTTELELRRQLRDFMRRGYQQRLFISSQGTFSARVDADSFLITPYRTDRPSLEVEDFVLVRKGAVEAGKTPSRATRNHEAIYAQHPDVAAVAYAYPVNATAFSVTSESFDSRTIPESYILLRDVPRVPFGDQFQGGRKLAESLSMKRPIALLQNDGVIAVGASVLDAFDRLEVLEATAEAIINARVLGEVASMPDHVIEELRTAFKLP